MNSIKLVVLDEQYGTPATTFVRKDIAPWGVYEYRYVKSMTLWEDMFETLPENNTMDNTMDTDLSQYHYNVSFVQFQLILRFGLVVKHDFTILHSWGDVMEEITW